MINDRSSQETIGRDRTTVALGEEVIADAPMILRAMEKGKFVRVNDSFKAMAGFDATELAMKPFLDWIDPCDRTNVQTALGAGRKTFFARHIKRDGSSFPLEIQLTEQQDGLFLLGRCPKDVNQLKPYEERPVDASLVGTLDAIAQIIEEQNPGRKCSILLIADGCFVFGAGPSLPEEYNAAINGSAIGPNVGSCGTAIFWNIPVIVEDIQADPLWAELAPLAKQAGVAACWSHPFVSNNGNVLGALALYSPEPCAPTTGQLQKLKAAARMTGLAVERGRAEEELRRSEKTIKAARNQLQATLNALPDLLFEVDSDGRIFSYHSPRSDLFAAPPEVFLDKRFADVLPQEAADACQRAIDEAAQSGFSYGETYRLILPQGEHWFELSVAPLHVDGQSDPHFIMISRDITKRKRAEEALQQKKQEMEQLVYIVSHDLKSPLVTVKSFMGILRQDLLNADQQRINEDLNYIDKAADKMQQLLDSLVQYSRIGRIDSLAQTLSADQQLHNCLTTLAGILQQHQVHVSNDDLPHQLQGDPLHFGQIWQNLIENAVKYRGDQPQPHIEIGATQEGHDVVFYVRDNGMGIAPEHRERIFNLFSQLQPGSDGSGLGLALVKKIVTIYQGRIWVESEGAGRGSCFMFTLPGALVKDDTET